MNNEIDRAFIRGMCKRAEELGFDKKAFVLPLASALTRGIGGMMLPGWLAGKALDAAQKTSWLQKNKRLSNILKEWHPMTGQGAKAMASNISSGFFLSPVVQPVVDRVADLIHKEQEPVPQQPYYPPQGYQNYNNTYAQY
jgi:hypothetical protein